MLCKPASWSVESYGLVLVLISSVLYAAMGAYVQIAHVQHSIPSSQASCARGLFQGSLVVLGLYTSRDPKTNQRLIYHPFGKTKAAQKLVLLRGGIGALGLVLDYYCLSVLPLGDAMTLMSLYPFLTILLARIILKEDLRPLHIGLTVASILGTICIGQPTFLFGNHPSTQAVNSGPPTFGYIAGILGSCCLASILILIRQAGQLGVHTLQLLVSWAGMGVMMSILVGWWEQDWMSVGNLLMNSQHLFPLLGVCVTGASAHFFLNYAGRLAPAGLVSVVRASDIVWAYALEVGVLRSSSSGSGVSPTTTLWTWCGVSLVVSSLVAVGLDQRRSSSSSSSSPQARIKQAPDEDEENPPRIVSLSFPQDNKVS